MSGFFSNLADEVIARRRRLRGSLGDRGQALSEFLVFSGLALGSLGLFLRPWMAGAAPWGFALPFVFLAGFLLIEARRQAALKRIGEGGVRDTLRAGYDWAILLWSLFCAVAGVAAFVIALQAEPAPVQQEEWTPPESAVSVDILP